jgi:hypothetical protein
MKRGAVKLRWAWEGDAQRSILHGIEPNKTGAERTSNFILNENCNLKKNNYLGCLTF